MTLSIKPHHVFETEKMAESIYRRSPKEQQEMLEALKERLIALTKEHLEIIRK